MKKDFLARLVLHDLSSPINIGQILRVAETFQVRVGVHDPRAVFANEAKRRTISDFACGALQRAAPFEVEAERARAPGRVIATCLESDAEPLPDFRFETSDLIYIGNEYDGLPPDLIRTADVRLRVPMPDVRTPKAVSASAIDPDRAGFAGDGDAPVLSASMTAAILCYDLFRKRRMA